MIVGFIPERDDLLGRGTGMTNLATALVCRVFNEAQDTQIATLPKVTKKRGRTIRFDEDGFPILNIRGSPKMFPNLIERDAVKIRHPPIKVQEFLVWRDLEQAYDCVLANRDNLTFWYGIKMISLDFVDNVEMGTDFTQRRLYKKAHWVFLYLSEVYQQLHFEHHGHQLQCILIRIIDWNCMKNMDVAGLFGLSLIPAVPSVRFLPGLDRLRLDKYIATNVRKAIQLRTHRTKRYQWVPTGLENPCPRTDWQAQACRRQRRGETSGDCMLRFLRTRYSRMFKLN